MVDLIDEVDEDLRREQLNKFWRKCGRYVVGGSAIIVLGTIAAVVWENHRLAQGERDTAVLLNVQKQLTANKNAEVINIVGSAENSGQSYSSLALMAEAQAHLKLNEWAKAADVYKKVADKESSGSALHDMALLLSAYCRVQADKNWKAFSDALTPLTEAGRPFAATAKELKASAAMAENDTVGALGLFKETVADAATSPTQKSRDAELISYLTPKATKKP